MLFNYKYFMICFKGNSERFLMFFGVELRGILRLRRKKFIVFGFGVSY